MFSKELEAQLKSGKIKTIGDLQIAFDEKSFAILFLLFMFIPSLPVPTGGITHVILLPVVFIASFQMMFGRRSLWFPWFISRIKLGDAILHKGLPFMIRRVHWFEKFSRPRLAGYLDNPLFRSLSGLCVFIFAVGAFVAPPFSGLDTLPSLGAVIISLAIILEDMVLYVAGIIIGAISIGIIVAAASVLANFIHHFSSLLSM